MTISAKGKIIRIEVYIKHSQKPATKAVELQNQRREKKNERGRTRACTTKNLTFETMFTDTRASCCGWGRMSKWL